MTSILGIISDVVGAVGIGIVVWGVVRGFVEFVAAEFYSLIPSKTHNFPFTKIHAVIARYLLLGLEFLVAADIIRTIIQPTLTEALILLIIIGIRVVLNIFLSREIMQYETSIPKNL